MKLFPPLKEISITEIEGLRIGNAQDLNAMTGVTVLRFDEGAKAGCDISGGGPASRETPLTSLLRLIILLMPLYYPAALLLVLLPATVLCVIWRNMELAMIPALQKYP